jgi:hypothetical protein
MWVMWASVEGYAKSMLTEILNQLKHLQDEAERESRKKGILSRLTEYCKEVKDRYFETMWPIPKVKERKEDHEEKKAKYMRRGQRYVYHFIVMEMELVDPTLFKQFPACFLLWVEEGLAAQDSMHPCKGVQEFDRAITDWEELHCLWYLDTANWVRPFRTERKAHQQIKDWDIPDAFFQEKKQGAVEYAPKSAADVLMAASEQKCFPDQSRKPRAKKPKAETEKKPSSSKASKFVNSSIISFLFILFLWVHLMLASALALSSLFH